MLLFYYINLVKLKMFWHFKIVGMTYSLGWRGYIIATQRCRHDHLGCKLKALEFLLVGSFRIWDAHFVFQIAQHLCTVGTVPCSYIILGWGCMSQPLSTYPRTVDFSLFIVVKCLVVTFGRYVDEQLMYLR